MPKYPFPPGAPLVIFYFSLVPSEGGGALLLNVRALLLFLPELVAAASDGGQQDLGGRVAVIAPPLQHQQFSPAIPDTFLLNLF